MDIKVIRLQFDLFYCRSRTPPHSAMATRCAGNSSNLTSDALSGDGAHLTSDTAASEGAHLTSAAALQLVELSQPVFNPHSEDEENTADEVNFANFNRSWAEMTLEEQKTESRPNLPEDEVLETPMLGENVKTHRRGSGCTNPGQKKRRAWAKQKKLERIAQGEQADLLPTISRSGGDSHPADQPSTYSAISHNASQLSRDSGDSHPADDAEEHSVPPAIASAGECATTLHAQPPAMLPALPSSSWPSGDLHPADSPNPDAPAKSKAIDATGNTASIRKVALASDTEHGGGMPPGGFVYQGRWYRGVAASNPIFLPPENFFIPQPQLWSQCACERICMRCVYDGEEFCEGCRATTLSVSSSTLYRSCNCEPGCCGLPGSSDLSESEEITEVSF